MGTIVAGTLGLVFWAVITKAEDWISKTTTSAIEKQLSDPALKRYVINKLDSSIIGASYQSHFLLGGPNSPPEHYIPIYVSGSNEVKLYLQIVHDGADIRRNVEIFIDEIPLPLDQKEVVKEPRFQRNINLTSYIRKSKELGIHDQDEKIYTIRFRINPTQKTRNTVSVRALINVQGLLRAPNPDESEQGDEQ